MQKNYIEIGYVIKTHGYKGDLKIQIHEGYETNIAKKEVLFISLKGDIIPYFVISFEWITSSEAIVRFEAYSNKEDAHELKSSAIYLNAEDVEIVKNVEDIDIRGYTVSDIQKGQIGTIEEVLLYPHQEMILVNYGIKKILIPLNMELVHEWSDESQTIIFNLPEGFLEI